MNLALSASWRFGSSFKVGTGGGDGLLLAGVYWRIGHLEKRVCGLEMKASTRKNFKVLNLTKEFQRETKEVGTCFKKGRELTRVWHC